MRILELVLGKSLSKHFNIFLVGKPISLGRFPRPSPTYPTYHPQQRQVIRLAKKYFDLDELEVEVIHMDDLEFLRKAGG